ncbi:regulator of G-protein signaling 14-like [Aplochiton taeniatus]
MRGIEKLKVCDGCPNILLWHVAMSLAVSDGELNVAVDERRGGVGLGQTSSSNNSLPTVPGEGASGVGEVASWAVSFERLLQDPTGVQYFTAFLKSEVSAENILFWQACEKFRLLPANLTDKLSREANSIYSHFLSSNASHPVNVDDTVRIEESDLKTPHPNMFFSAQQQIFKLMKFDSYRRFVRSQLYQNCMLANVEGRALPELSTRPRSTSTRQATEASCSATAEKRKSEQKLKEKSKLKLGKSLPLTVKENVENMRGEEGGEKKKGSLQNMLHREKRQEKRESWGELCDHAAVSRTQTPAPILRKTCPPNTTSTVSTNDTRLEMETSLFQYIINRTCKYHGYQLEPVKRTCHAAETEKYCCVYLPDGTASLAPVRPGLSIRGMLIGLCEKRGLPLNNVIIYLQGKAKQEPLSLDQDSLVLKEQQVYLELRVTLTVELGSSGKAVVIVVKSSKSLLEALDALLQKEGLHPHNVIVTMCGSKEPLSLNTAVWSLASKRVRLNRVQGPEERSFKLRRGAVVEENMKASSQANLNTRQRKPAARKTYDMDGLMELLSKAQCCNVDDQRGLLNKEQLWLPQFLQCPLVEEHPLEHQGLERRGEMAQGEDCEREGLSIRESERQVEGKKGERQGQSAISAQHKTNMLDFYLPAS